MNKKFLVIFFTIAFFTNSITQNTQESNIKIDLLNSEVQSFIEKYDIPDAAVAIVNKDSTWIGTYGFVDKDKKVQISNETIF